MLNNTPALQLLPSRGSSCVVSHDDYIQMFHCVLTPYTMDVKAILTVCLFPSFRKSSLFGIKFLHSWTSVWVANLVTATLIYKE